MKIPLRLLMVADSEPHAASVLAELRNSGYDPVGERVSTSEETGRALLRERWEVVIAEHFLPRFNGTGVLKLVRKIGLDVPVVIVSEAKRGEEIAAVMKAGARDCVMRENLSRLGQVIGRELREVEMRRLTRHVCEEFGRMEKMETVGRLAGGVAHEINNIMQVILGHASLLDIHFAADDPRRQHTAMIGASVEKAIRIIDGLLTFSGKKEMSLEPTDLNRLIREAEELLRGMAGRNVYFRMASCHGDLPVMADSRELTQALVNLLGNALRAMPSGGDLVVATERSVICGGLETTKSLVPPGEYAVLSVTDSGKGMGEKMRARVFEPFFTTRDAGTETGLGLSVVYGIVRQHGGFIDVVSKEGEGSAFRMYFPIRGTESRDQRGETPDIGKEKRETILFADDDNQIRILFRGVFEQLGCRVIDASNGAEAVLKFSRHQREIDLVVLDTIMPRMGGLETYRVIKKLSPATRFLLVGAHAGEELYLSASAGNGDDCLAKRVSYRELPDMIRRMLDA